MPLYEYGCESCGHRLEIQQKLADAPLKTCPNCGKETLSKLISATAFVLKGSGWYKDGYSGQDKNKRSEKQVTDRVQKAVDDDKKKTESAPAAAASGSSTPSAAPAGGSSSSSGGDKGSSAHVS